MKIYFAKLLLKKKRIVLVFVILCTIFTTENAFSYKFYGFDSFKIGYNAGNKKIPANIQIYFKFFDADFPNPHQHAYLERFSVQFETDDSYSYNLLLSGYTSDQENAGFSMIELSNIREKEIVDFSSSPADPKVQRWKEKNDRSFKVKIPNHPQFHKQTWICFKWFADFKHLNITTLRLSCSWVTPGVKDPQQFSQEIPIVIPEHMRSKSNTDRRTTSLNKCETSLTENNAAEVTKEADEIIIKGVEQGQNIHVYSSSGVLMNTSVVKEDITSIRLLINQLYSVKIGDASYKIAL